MGALFSMIVTEDREMLSAVGEPACWACQTDHFRWAVAFTRNGVPLEPTYLICGNCAGSGKMAMHVTVRTCLAVWDKEAAEGARKPVSQEVRSMMQRFSESARGDA